MTSPKMKIYPFECHLKSETGEFKGQVVALTTAGFLFNAGTHVLKPSDYVHVRMELPLVDKHVEGSAMVYKTYDTFKGHHGLINPGDHLIEFIFKTIEAEYKNSISQFLAHVQAHSV